MNTKDVKIFVCYHKNTPVFESECIIPIHVGKANSSVNLNMIGDNTKDNISDRNGSWCELTALYWMWKNVQADYYGLFHYRRFLNFNQIGGGYEVFTDFSDDNIQQFGWTDEKIRNVCSQYDILTSPIWKIHPAGLPHMIQTNYDFYDKEHFIKDLDIVINLIKEKYPEIYPYALKSLYSTESFFANMMIMKKEYFNEYCEWIFDILFTAEQLIDISEYDSYQKRIWGFIAERLANCFLEYLKAKNTYLKHTSLGMAYGVFSNHQYEINDIISNVRTNKQNSINMISRDAINIAFTIDDKYAKNCAITIKSIVDNANPKQKFKFFIICDKSFSNEMKLHLLDFENENIKIIFLNANPDDFAIYPLNGEHISIITYYRLELHKILPNNVDKVIYLDADTIVLDNICKLWATELDDDYLLAGSLDEGGIIQMRRLGLPISHNYINSGVCLINIKKMRSINLEHLYAESFYRYRNLISLQEQDILNIAFVNQIKKLHCKWNVQSRFYREYNDLEYAYSDIEAKEAILTPSIIHFSSGEKPWHSHCNHVLKFYFAYYQSLLNTNWHDNLKKQDNYFNDDLKINIKNNTEKQEISNLISYNKFGKNAELKITLNNKVRSFTFKRKLGRKIGKIIYNVIRAFLKCKKKLGLL